MNSTAIAPAKEKQWLTKAEAATILGESVRAIERKAKEGKIETTKAACKGRRPATLYSAADVERIRDERQMSQRGASQLAPLPRQQPPRLLQEGGTDAIAHTSLTQLATIAAALRSGAAMSPRRWIKVEEAATDSGLSKRFLHKLCRGGELLSVWDEGQWKIASDALQQWTPAANRSANVIEINLPAAVAADIDDDATGHAILYAVTTCERALALCEKLLLERSASASCAATLRNAS